MKELGKENRRLNMYADAQLSADLLREALAKRVRPSQRRAMAQHAVESQRTPIRHACATFALSEKCYRYVPSTPTRMP